MLALLLIAACSTPPTDPMRAEPASPAPASVEMEAGGLAAAGDPGTRLQVACTPPRVAIRLGSPEGFAGERVQFDIDGRTHDIRLQDRGSGRFVYQVVEPEEVLLPLLGGKQLRVRGTSPQGAERNLVFDLSPYDASFVASLTPCLPRAQPAPTPLPLGLRPLTHADLDILNGCRFESGGRPVFATSTAPLRGGLRFEADVLVRAAAADVADPSEGGTFGTEAVRATVTPGAPAVLELSRDEMGSARVGGTWTCATSGLERLNPSDVPRDLAHEGDLVGAFRWTDRNGTNTLLFSAAEPSRPRKPGVAPEDQEHARTLHVDHYAGGAAPKRLRHVQDFVEDCEFDVTGTFVQVPDELVLTDLDADGVNEVSFGYRLACRSDVSPSTLKVLLLEDGDKYILRGQSRVKIGPEDVIGGDFAPGKAFPGAPDGFRSHAEKVWSAVAPDAFRSDVGAP